MLLARPGAATPTGPLLEVSRESSGPGPGEVRIEVGACAVCRTDLQLCEGDLEARRLPIVPGHQAVGRIMAVGDGVPPGRVGVRVGVAWLAGWCGECRFCRTGRQNLCERATFTGWDRDGGFARSMLARNEAAHAIPSAFDGVDDHAVAPLLCGGVIGYRSLRIAGVGPRLERADTDETPGRLGLYGFGASATYVAQVASHWGWEVYAVTRSEAEQARARRLGAVWAGGYDDRPPVPLDAAITFAPVGWVVVRALEAVDRGGTVAVNAIHLDRIPEFPYERLWWERTLRSVANVTPADVRNFLDLAARAGLRADTEVFPLREANDALARLKDGRISGAAVLTCAPPHRPR
jgi:propanol-preferring alcohol dehydrogenase